MRYLNFIDLPMAVELSDYLLTAPVLPPGVPQKIASFFAQTLVRLEETDMYAVLRQGTMPMSNPGTVRIAVDVETLQRRQKGPVTADEAIEVFERLHEHEVDFFERCITNRTRELFD